MEGRFSEIKVWVNGTFDVLHIGHIKLLEFASEFGQVRVGLDDDKRVKLLKGESRPVNNIKDRLEFIKSIKYINSAVSFSDEEDLKRCILEWETDIIIVGSDYKNKKVVGSELVKKVLFFDRIADYSTTKIISNL
jgi:D-beta-D-heptose 7-phosphate kinase/D-beta-D-heptose 1-phosphate adenosyltransferase